MATAAMPPQAQKPLGAGYEITIMRTFEAPPELVFDCFTDPRHFAAWWGPLGCQSVVHVLDARPGGEISVQMVGQGYDHPMGGEFVEIDRPRRLVFKTKAFEAPDGGWGIVNRNTVTFEPHPMGTRMTLHTLVERAQGGLVLGALSGMHVGWSQSLEKLGDLVGGGGKTDIEVSDKRVVVTRAFDTTPARLWQALTDPKDLAGWWAGGGATVETFDLRPGGQWSIRTPGANGATHRFYGEFREVNPPTRLAMSQGFDQYPPVVEVTQEISQAWGRTVLTRTMVFPENIYRDGMLNAGFDRGMAATYDRLAEVVAD
jgi:uncharacterized protein YndB with AHSA1/START domain